MNSSVYLACEFALLYLIAPVLFALFLPPDDMFAGLVVFGVIGVLLLGMGGRFRWSSLAEGWREIPWGLVAVACAATICVGFLVLYLSRPDALFFLPRNEPGLLLIVWLAYPFLSALPQELIFRVLFFHRYIALRPAFWPVIAFNACVFALTHMMYWSWIALGMSFCGGLIFAYGYVRYNFLTAWVLHALLGNIIFTLGLGIYFYTGNVVKPF